MKASTEKVISLYKAFLIDLWGVVHNGAKPYPGVVNCLNRLISQKVPLLFISNAPRPGTVTMNKLLEFGIQVNIDMMLTSGDVVRQQLEKFDDANFSRLGKCFYHLGANRNQDILADLPVSLSLTESLEKADFILLTAYLDEGEDLDQYNELLNKTATLNIPMVCANPDKIVINGNSQRYCAGFFAEKYEAMGGTVFYYGKPYPEILKTALQKLKNFGIMDKKQILMIGDTLETDILSAKEMGTDSALVLTGNTELLLETKNDDKILESDFLANVFEKTGIKPTWIIPGLGSELHSSP